MNKGLLVINKPKDWTSFDVVNKIKHLLKIKRVGHLGTLDPMATGVLLVTFGTATKLFDIMQEKTKTYIAEFELNRLTDTLDATGKTLNYEPKKINRDDLERATNSFVGEIDQIPPKYSAKSINGKRAYDLARENVDFTLPAKRVTIYSIKLIDFDESNNHFTIEVSCSSGTYIRSLGRDIASKLDTFATMTSLVRTLVGKFSLDDAVSVLDLNTDNILNYCLKLIDALDYPRLVLNETDEARLLNGQTLIIDKNDGLYMLKGTFDAVAIVKIEKNHAKMSVFLG